MRIYHKDNRISLEGVSDEVLFKPELDYYRKNNQYHVDLFGVHVINIYRRINVQIIITKTCNFDCPFCIERDGLKIQIDESNCNLPFYVKEVLLQYIQQGIVPTISITGGEPTLHPQRLTNILDIISKFWGMNKIECVNLNTNGTNLKCMEDFPWVSLNISRHHYNFNDNMSIFGSMFKAIDARTTERSYLQCVLLKDYINNVESIKKYINVYSMARGFSFRSLTVLDSQKRYFKEAQFTKDNYVDIKFILDQIDKDPDFTFIQQKIGDHYIYEIYRYRGKIVRFVYSNFDWLRQVEIKEREQGDIFSRATIIEPTAVYSGWAYDINRIYGRD